MLLPHEHLKCANSNLVELVVGDKPVLVDVVDVEGEPQLPVEVRFGVAGKVSQTDDELLEVDLAAQVVVENFDNSFHQRILQI